MRAVLVLTLVLGGCLFFDEEQCACTASYAFALVKVVDGAGNPIDGLVPQTIRVATGDDITPDDANAGEHGPGMYMILSDDSVRDLGTRPEALRFEARGAQGVATLDFMAFTDACHCHIQVLAHPDVLVLQ